MWDQNQLRGCNTAGIICIYAFCSVECNFSSFLECFSAFLKTRASFTQVLGLEWRSSHMKLRISLLLFFFRFSFKESSEIFMLTSSLVFCLYCSSPGSEKHTQASAQCDCTVSPGCQPANAGFSDWLFSAHSTYGYRSWCLRRYNHHPLSCKNT